MKKIALISAYLATMVFQISYAEEIPLPDFVGEYSGASGERSIVFEFSGDPSEISSAYLSLSGSINTSWVSSEGDTTTWGGEFTAAMYEPDAGFWMAFTDWGEAGEFQAIIPFLSIGGATWDFLADGQGEIHLGFNPYALVGSIDGTGPEPTGSISSATLVIEGPVAEESFSFGQFKALYR